MQRSGALIIGTTQEAHRALILARPESALCVCTLCVYTLCVYDLCVCTLCVLDRVCLATTSRNVLYVFKRGWVPPPSRKVNWQYSGS